METPWISCRAYAKHRGVTPMAVSDAIKSGRIGPPAVVRDQNGQPKIADVALADEQWARNTDPVRAANALVQGTTAGPPQPLITTPPKVLVAGPPPPVRGTIDAPPPSPQPSPTPDEPESAATATERLKAAQADLAELKRDEARRELVRASEVKKKLDDVFSACKTRLLAIPSRARQALPHMPNADVLVLEGLIREALEELAT